MPKVVGVRFRGIGKAYHFAPGELNLVPGDVVLVHTSQGDSLGVVSDRVTVIDESQLKSELKPVLRIATTEDEAVYEENGQREKEAYKICRQKIREHELDMNLVDVECVFDRSRMIFYFTSEGRVDFRHLVRDLAQIFRIRIELRQIGVRDEARMVGGLGICGRPLCCTSFLNDFIPVSIKMAKEQGLSMNPGKLSGCCGRLMCCLKYEQAAYEAIRKKMPKVGAVLQLEKGKFKVEAVDYLREKFACFSLDNVEEKCVLDVEAYQTLIHGGQSSLNVETQSASTHSDFAAAIELDAEEQAVMEQMESQYGKTQILVTSGETPAIVLPERIDGKFTTEKSCCCQKQTGHGHVCQGGCCSQKQEREEDLPEATLHGVNLDELAQKNELKTLPNWIDAEIILEEETTEEVIRKNKTGQRLRHHARPHQNRGRGNEASERVKPAQRRSNPLGYKAEDEHTHHVQQPRSRSQKRGGVRSGNLRQTGNQQVSAVESQPQLTKVQNKSRKSAENARRKTENDQKNHRLAFAKKERKVNRGKPESTEISEFW